MQHRLSGSGKLPMAAAIGLAMGAGIVGAAGPGLGQNPADRPSATPATGVDVDTFLADPMTLLGSQVTLTGCRIAGFISDAAGCYAESGRGRVSIDPATFDRASLRQALKHCTDTGPLTACHISVSGFVEQDAQKRIRLRNAVAISADSGTH
ncbi:hypothetical protein AB4Z01_01600 [Inquilinus sp. YAF38]|uniref:hypothetical protein n=1 Tax=Inquilinus sp. YAF38 TaxID=3233084 RepID=UPI003F931433